jgi:hypothetical protein
MSLNDELLSLDKKLKYYTLETFKDVPIEPGIYAWFYPLRIIDDNLNQLVEEINFIFNFNHDSESEDTAKTETEMGWRKYTVETKFTEISKNHSLFSSWNSFIEEYTSQQEYLDDCEKFNDLKRIIFVSSIFLPPLYIGKTNNLNRRCREHVDGIGSDNVFHRRYNEYASKHLQVKCKYVGQLIFGCISTKVFDNLPENNEQLIEQILMNLIKPIFSIK